MVNFDNIANDKLKEQLNIIAAKASGVLLADAANRHMALRTLIKEALAAGYELGAEDGYENGLAESN